MKTVLVLATVLAAALALPADTYNPALENLNADEIASNTRLLQSYGKCMLGEGPCTPEGTEITKIIPEAIERSCDKCSPKQRVLIRTMYRAFEEKLPEILEALKKKYDPKNEHKEDIKKFMESTD